MGSKTLFNTVFIRPEQVVRFLLCKQMTGKCGWCKHVVRERVPVVDLSFASRAFLRVLRFLSSLYKISRLNWEPCFAVRLLSARGSAQWRGQPDIWSCKFFSVYRPYKESISKEMNNDDLNLHSMTKLPGWLRYWFSDEVMKTKNKTKTYLTRLVLMRIRIVA